MISEERKKLKEEWERELRKMRILKQKFKNADDKQKGNGVL
jgi:hypothetical protein